MKYLDNIFIKNQRDKLFCVSNLEGHFIELNSIWTNQLGWSLEELIGHPFINYLHPKDISSTLKANKTLIQKKAIKYENRFRCKNGGYAWLSWTSTFDQESQLVFSVLEDVTTSKRNEFILKDIQNTLKIGHWEMDLETQDVFWSEMTHIIHETDPKTFKPKLKDGLSFYHPESIPPLTAALDKLMAKAIPFDLELKFITAKGKHIWVRATGDASLFEGKVQRIFGTFQDIDLVHKTKEQIDQVLKNCPVMFYQFKLHPDGSASFPMVSDYCYELYGLTPEVFLSSPSIISSYVHPDDQEELNKQIQYSAETLTSFDWEGRIISTKKVLKWIKGRANPEREEDGSIRWDGAVIDITKEVELKSENKIITKALKVGMWKWDLETNIQIWDEGMYALYGITPKEYDGTVEGWMKFLTEDSRPQIMKEFALFLKEKKDFFNNFKIVTKAGEIRHLRNHGVVIKNKQGEIQKVYGLNWDRTTEAMLENSLELERAKSLQSARLASLGEMSAAIAHEINNPLAIISGTIALLKKAIDDPNKFDAKINSVNKSVSRIVKIINGLRKFTRESSTRTKSPHVLSDIINESLSLTGAKLKHSETELTLEIKSDASIACDEVEIEQVIVNLINNAVDAIKNLPTKWVKIKLTNEGSEVVMRVIDSGHGIPKNIAYRIFDPFFTTKPVGEGTGLGLSISKGIIEDHGGTIAVTEENGNTCFEIRLPFI